MSLTNSGLRILLSFVFLIGTAANAAPKKTAQENDDDEATIRFDRRGKARPGTSEPVERLLRVPAPGAQAQTCDPKLMDAFYDSIYQLACQKSQLAQCPIVWDMNLLKGSINSLIGYASFALIGGAMVKADLNRQALDRSKLSLSRFSPQAERMFGPLASAHMQRLSQASDVADLNKWMAQGRETYISGAQHARYHRFLNMVEKSQRHNRNGIIQALGKAKGPVIGSIIFSYVFDFFSPTDPRHCPNKIPYIEYAQGCKPEVEADGELKIGDEVRKFLDLNSSEQEVLLNANPQLCDYYKRFNEAIRQKIEVDGEVKNIKCDAGSGVRQFTVAGDGRAPDRVFSLKVGPSNRIEELHVDRPSLTMRSERFLKEFRISFRQSENQSILSHGEFTNLWGVSRSMSYSTIADLVAKDRRHMRDHLTAPAVDMFDAFRQHKYYSNLVNTCCSIRDDAMRTQCTEELEGHKGITLKEAEEKAAKRAAHPPTVAPPAAAPSLTVDESHARPPNVPVYP